MLKLVLYNNKDMSLVKNLYLSSFPSNERRPFSELFLPYKSNNFFEIYDDDIFVGIIASLTYNCVTFITYFAIEKDKQNKGYGSMALKKIMDNFDGNIFIADLEYCDINDTQSLKYKRKKFYEKNGFYKTEIEYKWKNVRYQIFSTDKNYSEVMFDKFWDSYSDERE